MNIKGKIGAMKFKHLPVGAKFYFGSEFQFPLSGMKRGECVKTATRSYEYIGDGMKCKVGSINTDIIASHHVLIAGRVSSL